MKFSKSPPPSVPDKGPSDFAGVSTLDSSQLFKSEGEGINLERRRKSQITEGGS